MSAVVPPDSMSRVAALQATLRARVGGALVLVLTDNRSRVFSAVQRGDVLRLRLHRRFLDAPPSVVDALGDLLTDRHPDAARATLRAWWRAAAVPPPRSMKPMMPASANDARVVDDTDGDGEFDGDEGERGMPPSARGRTARTGGARDHGGENIVGVTAAGEHHDLALYGAHLNATYLGGRSAASIRWGARVRRRGPTRTIRLGCFYPTECRIVMNRRLDRAEVPRYFVEYILFHEMLHEVLGIGERPDGRREIHGSLFKLMERTYPDVDRALAFERQYFGGG